jgi:hypothetical protein
LKQIPGNGRIVGGAPVPEEESTKYPYMLSLQWFGNHICGATLINETHAITAG